MNQNIHASQYRLNFHHAFHIAHGSRTHTDTVYVELKQSELTGYGEAALPPYLGYDADAVVAEINSFQFPDGKVDDLIRFLYESTLSRPAKTAIDIALHDLAGKQKQQPYHQLAGSSIPAELPCFYTLGISPISELEEKLQNSKETRIYKIKLGGQDDEKFLRDFRNLTDAAFCADANQAWKSESAALQKINMLHDLGCLFIEQPLPVDHPDQHLLHKKSKLPIYLDESIQSKEDIIKSADSCSGINIKLLKAGGMYPAMEWISAAQDLELKILIGCMSESSCGAAAAMQLSGVAEYVDLDGPLLIANDPFTGLKYENGMLKRTTGWGIGVKRK